MGEEGRPTGITHEQIKDAVEREESIDFEGRKARVVEWRGMSRMGTQHQVRLEIDLEGGYLILFGYWSGNGELMETGRESPF